MTEEEIQLLIEMDIAVWESYLAFLSAQIQQLVGLGAFAGLSRADIIKNITDAALSSAQVETLVTTSLNNYSRAVTRTIMEDEPNDTLYQYIGPIDGRTRDICLFFASSGEITETQIKKLRGGEESLSFGGGYNCRHKWQSISEFGVSKNIYNPKKADELLPEEAREKLSGNN